MTLAAYLQEVGESRSAFARRIGVSPESIRRYLDDGRVPQPKVMRQIALATACRVTANDFFGIVTPQAA